MTILIAAAAFCAWAYFWVRGALWAAVSPAIAVLALELFAYRDQGHFDGIGIWVEIAVIFIVGITPYAIKRYRAAKMDRLLNGIRFRDVRGD